MSLIYFQESKIEACFLTAFSALDLDKSINDVSLINYSPLKLSFLILNLVANQNTNESNYYQKIIANYDKLLNKLSPEEGAIALFPLFLYCYRDNCSLERELEEVKSNLSEVINLNSWKILIIVINLIIENKINNNSILKQITDNLEEYQEEEIREIKLIDELINNKIYLNQAEEILRENIDKNSLGIYQGIYNFFCLPYNSEITLNRSKKFSHSQEVTRVLTGFLLGLNNGYHGIPPLKDIQYEGKAIDKIIKQFVAQWQGKIAQ